MCEAATIIAGVTLAAGAGLSAVSSIQQGKAARRAGEFNQAVADNNAELARRAAADAVRRGEDEVRKQGQLTAQAKARARVALAGAGVEVGTGSALDVQEDIAAIGKEDQLTLRRNALREALGFRQEAANFTASGQLADFQGRSAETAGRIGAAGTLLSAGGNIAGSFFKTRKPTARSRGPQFGGTDIRAQGSF